MRFGDLYRRNGSFPLLARAVSTPGEREAFLDHVRLGLEATRAARVHRDGESVRFGGGFSPGIRGRLTLCPADPTLLSHADSKWLLRYEISFIEVWRVELFLMACDLGLILTSPRSNEGWWLWALGPLLICVLVLIDGVRQRRGFELAIRSIVQKYDRGQKPSH